MTPETPVCNTLEKQTCKCSVIGHKITRCEKCFQAENPPVIIKETGRYQWFDRRTNLFGNVKIDVIAKCPKCGEYPTKIYLYPH
jgi:hypothetical protein